MNGDSFRILQFTDLHYGEGADLDVNSSRIQAIMLQHENPDLVVMTGDMVSGYAWDKTQGWFAKRWAQLTQPMIKASRYWATALGNHDDEADLDRDQIVKLDTSNPLSLTQRGPLDITGATNYVLTVRSTNGDPVVHLWFFDSGDDNCLGVKGWDCVHPNQVQWYLQKSQELIEADGRVVPGLAFFHIPFPEFMNVWNYETCYGKLEDEGVCCFSVNTGLYAAMRSIGNIASVHCGHDHDNDFFGNYYNITLAYGRKSGYGGYGPPPGWLRGARILEISQNPFRITSWIRQEDGSRVDEQPIHLPGTKQTFLCCDALGKDLKEKNGGDLIF
eukprot:TRINITY_DN7224_c0_g1_i1.p1 TRINITY_DN7224_c0_g1~~TRINITY_DN7224_c0_g1_i1.p1  ORF type:complete len:360 (+),score=55.58 TRINITY_DN7224_c0_g1_i1:89-1081(+)